MADSQKLANILRFHPHPGPQPDPASLLQFIVDLEQPELTKAALTHMLQLAVETQQAQLKFVQNLQKSMGQGT